jgi:uncharacterized protein YjbI with pentapeptide repeats
MNSDFRYASLEHANFQSSRIFKSDFRFASFREAKLVGVDLSDCDLRGCDLRGIDPNTLGGAQGSRLDETSLVCLSFDYSEGGPFEIGADLARERWLEKGGIFDTE